MLLLGALIVSFGVAMAYLQALRLLVRIGAVSSTVSRKLLHIGIGALYMVCWRLYPSSSPAARFVASAVPFAVTAAFALVGSGLRSDAGLVRTMARTGDRRELLRGPLLYGVAHVALTWLFWTRSPAGAVALCALCGGDGVAEIAGQRVRSARLPWNGAKSVAGSAAFVLAAFAMALAVLPAAGVAGFAPWSSPMDLARLLFVVVAAAFVETLPVREFDNATVPAAAALLSCLVF